MDRREHPLTELSPERGTSSGDVLRARISLGREEGKCNRQELKPFVVDLVGVNPTR
jgi:hypothetical protein